MSPPGQGHIDNWELGQYQNSSVLALYSFHYTGEYSSQEAFNLPVNKKSKDSFLFHFKVLVQCFPDTAPPDGPKLSSARGLMFIR